MSTLPNTINQQDLTIWGNTTIMTGTLQVNCTKKITIYGSDQLVDPTVAKPEDQIQFFG